MSLVRRIVCCAVTVLASRAEAQILTPAQPATAPALPPLVVRHEVPPPQMTRTLRTFDFEERSRGNVEDTPLGWVKVEGPGLPRYLKGQFDAAVSAAGQTSFRVDLNGGSVTYRYPAGRIPVMPHAVYRIEAMARTTPLANARARVTAYFCDVDGRVLQDTIRTSAALANAPGDETFHPLEVELTADTAAASLVIEMGLLQPALLNDSTLGDQKLLVEDIRGSAWFDELRVAQVPDVLVATDHATNVFYRDEPINLRLRVRDRITTDLSAELRILDVDGRPVFQRTGGIDFAVSGAGDELVGTIPVPRLAAGWYEARLSLASQGRHVIDQSLKLVQLSDLPLKTLPDARFGIVATQLAPHAWPLLPEILDQLVAGRVKLSVWSQDNAVESNGAAIFDELLDQLKLRNVSLTAALTALPPDVRRATGAQTWTDLLKVPAERWQPQLAYLVARHATHLQQWQLMDDSDADRFAREPDARRVYDLLYGEFAKLIGTPDLAMPWPAWFDFEEAAPPTVALAVPGEILPEQLPLYIADLKSRRGHSVSLTLQPIDRARYGRNAQMRDLALRIAFALAGGADRIDLPLPLTASVRRDQVLAEPDQLLPTQRTITAQLSNARYVGKVPIAEGVDAFLFDRKGGRGGVMLVWARGDVGSSVVRRVPITLGQHATKVDLLGNVTPLLRTMPGDRKWPLNMDLEVGTMPIFITDIDASLMMLRASIAIDNPLLESSFKAHSRKLRLTNTFDAPVTGTIKLAGPAGWSVTVMGGGTFSLAPGETFETPVTIEFPLNSFAGEKVLTADLKILGRDDYRLSVPIALKLGLSDVGLQTIAIRDGDEVVVQQMVTNYGTKPINYTAFVSLPGQPRQERLLSNLGPSKTTIRKYRFALPKGKPPTIRSGVRELDGRRMLNEEVEIY